MAFQLVLMLVLLYTLDLDGQTQRRRISLDVGYGLLQENVLYDGDTEVEFNDEAVEEVTPITIGLNYRFTRKMSLYGEFTRSHNYFDFNNERTNPFDAQYSIYSAGIMPLSGFLEFGFGYSRIQKNQTVFNKTSNERREISDESFHGANLRLRLDFKIFEGMSVYAGGVAYGMLPLGDVEDIEALGNVNVGVQFYLLGKDKKYISRRERKKLKRMRREQDLKDLEKMRKN